MADRILRRGVNVFDEETGHHRYQPGTVESDIPEGHLAMITNPKAWVSYETMDEDFGLIPEHYTREDFRRAAAANSPRDDSDGDDAEEDDLSGKTVPELHEIAAEEAIDLGEATRKADIVKAIRDARNL